MQSENEMLNRISNIENIIDEMYTEIMKIRKICEDRNLEGIHIMTRIENISDFVKNKYNTSI